MMKNRNIDCISCKDEAGFTLVELVVAMVVGLIVMGAIYLTSQMQEAGLSAEESIAELQSNLRAGITVMEHDIRMAGYDPNCLSPPCKGFTSATASSFTITFIDPESNNPVTITYQLYDSGGDGDTDLGRSRNGSGNQPLILNVDAFDILYFDKNGVQLTPPFGSVALGTIAYAEITIVAHTEKPDPKLTNTMSFTNLQGATIYTSPGDNFRRRVMRTRVMCRNNI